MKIMGCRTELLGEGQGLVARVLALMRAQEKLRDDQGVRQVHASQNRKYISPLHLRDAEGAMGPEDSVQGCTTLCSAFWTLPFPYPWAAINHA